VSVLPLCDVGPLICILYTGKVGVIIRCRELLSAVVLVVY